MHKTSAEASWASATLRGGLNRSQGRGTGGPGQNLPAQYDVYTSNSREDQTVVYPEIAAHLMRVTETAHWLEWQDWAYPVLAEPFRLQDGCLMVPDKPGVGIEWDEKNVGGFAL